MRNSLLINIVALLLLGIWQHVALAQGSTSMLGDHPLVSRFPDSTLEEIEVVEHANYRLVLGSLQRNREVVVPENSLRLRGDVTKIVYQVPQQYTSQEVYDYFQTQFEAKDFTELFSCSSRGCGSSNYWANDIFSNRILYGPERNQFFSAFRIGEEGAATAHLSLYVITRANRRIYAYMEIVEEDLSSGVVAIASPELLETLNQRGVVTVPGVQFAADGSLSDSTDLSAVIELLQSNRQLRFFVVGHLAGDASLDQLIQRSTQRAELVRQELIRRGIAGNRLEAQGVGPLAPACEIADCADRIELVINP